MKNCYNCTFCKKDLLSDYIQEVDFYKCDMDEDIIFDPVHEGKDCSWYKGKARKTKGVLETIVDWLF